MALVGRLPPAARAAITSATVMTCGDLLCQSIQRRRQAQPKPYDLDRARNFGLIGLTLHGPYFLYGFRALDQAWGPSTSLGNALRKTATGQLTLFPVYLAAFFAYMGLLEGRSLPQALDKVKAMFVPAFTSGCVFWPIANILNFKFVPTTSRVVYVNVMGLAWNAFLSYINSTNDVAPAKATPLVAPKR